MILNVVLNNYVRLGLSGSSVDYFSRLSSMNCSFENMLSFSYRLVSVLSIFLAVYLLHRRRWLVARLRGPPRPLLLLGSFVTLIYAYNDCLSKL